MTVQESAHGAHAQEPTMHSPDHPECCQGELLETITRLREAFRFPPGVLFQLVVKNESDDFVPVPFAAVQALQRLTQENTPGEPR